MELAIEGISSVINVLIPAFIFLFLNDKIFLSKANSNRGDIRKKLLRLLFVSPIGFFLILSVVLITLEMVVGAFLFATGVTDFTNESAFIPKLSTTHFISLESGVYGNTNDGLLASLVLAVVVAVPVLVLVIRTYCKIIGCSRGLGIFVYMAVLYMYLTSTLITLPISEINQTAEGLISTGSFIVMLLIFYQSAADKIEFMRKNEDSELLDQINTLPIINFILQVILLGLEIMLQNNGYMDLAYYLLILAFTIILYISAQLAYSILFRHIEERSEIEELSKESLAAQEQVTLAFAEITEAKSGQTGQHIKRVSEYSRILAEGLGYEHHDVETIRIASMMHDVGKLLIPPEILEKCGRLTDDEFEIMKTHVVIGENLLHNAPGEIMHVARVIAQQHHEKWNGMGYLGMKGEEIEQSARITAVADVYDALTSNRSYKKAWYSEQAFDMIKNERGEHFDPEVVDVFIERFDEIKAIQEKYSDNKKS
jgi:HD-GYP domain-containing protein (c-di-GMP phosphodiesterase class II)